MYRIPPVEAPVAFHRNGWPVSIAISGQFHRNAQPRLSGGCTRVAITRRSTPWVISATPPVLSRSSRFCSGRRRGSLVGQSVAGSAQHYDKWVRSLSLRTPTLKKSKPRSYVARHHVKPSPSSSRLRHAATAGRGGLLSVRSWAPLNWKRAFVPDFSIETAVYFRRSDSDAEFLSFAKPPFPTVPILSERCGSR